MLFLWYWESEGREFGTENAQRVDLSVDLSPDLILPFFKQVMMKVCYSDIQRWILSNQTMCVMFVCMTLQTEEVAVCKNTCKHMTANEGMRMREATGFDCMSFVTENGSNSCSNLHLTSLYVCTFIPRHMRHQSTRGPQWDGSPMSRHWHKHSLSIVIIIATVTANLSQAVLTLVPSIVEESIQQQGNLDNSINSVAARQPIKNTESVSLPLPIVRSVVQHI